MTGRAKSPLEGVILAAHHVSAAALRAASEEFRRSSRVAILHRAAVVTVAHSSLSALAEAWAWQELRDERRADAEAMCWRLAATVGKSGPAWQRQAYLRAAMQTYYAGPTR